MKGLIQLAALASAFVLVVGVAGAAPPQEVACGEVITQSTRLANDVGPCTGDGIIVGADNVTLDLNGHRVFGTPQPGEGAGILVSQRTGVDITDGTVSDFDGGVVIEGGSRNLVKGITARDNIGQSIGEETDTLYGDGIAVLSSTDNQIIKNRAIHNGPFSGIGLFREVDDDHPRDVSGPASGNRITDNEVRDNDICRIPERLCDNDGIRLEPGVQDNDVIANVVTGSALDGISIFRRADNNRAQANRVEGNGFHLAAHRKGDGIRVFSNENAIEGNRVFDNAADGIGVGFRSPRGTLFPAVNNRIVGNRTGANRLFDLHDFSPDCDNNLWRGNRYDTADPPCTTGP